MHQNRPRGADASDARQSRRKELIAVRRRVPEGLGGPGSEAAPEGGQKRYYREVLRRKIMNRLALNKTTRPLLYGAMGSGIILALLPLALVLGTNPAQAITPTITQSFSVPIIHTPAKVYVAVNGEASARRSSM
jgi:hypothetical protein